MSSRRSFLAYLPAFLGGAAAVPGLVKAAESEPPLPVPLTHHERTRAAFMNRLDACCRRQGKTLDDVAREVGDVMGRRIRPEGLVPQCCEKYDKWLLVVSFLAIYVLDVTVGWLAFGEDPGPEWWVGAS